MPEEPSRDIGKAIKWEQKMLTSLSEVTPRDLVEADSFWRTHAPRDFRDVLAAKVDARIPE